MQSISKVKIENIWSTSENSAVLLPSPSAVRGNHTSTKILLTAKSSILEVHCPIYCIYIIVIYFPIFTFHVFTSC